MPNLFEVTILLLACALAAPIGRFSRFGSVLAFTGIGLLIGPSVLGLIHDPDTVLQFSEISVVFLLFIIGLELQPRRLWALRTTIFGAGSLQLTLSAVALAGLSYLLGLSVQAALVTGYGLALSSTAFALRLLADNGELASAQGRLGFGVLLFQDLAVIPFLAVLPLLAPVVPAEEAPHFTWWVAALIFIGFTIACQQLLVPFLRLIAWSGVQEAFTATSLLLVLGSAWVMEEIGLSMGLGAFIAGVLVADSAYRHQLEADIEPFKALLLGLFFMAVGMSTQLNVLFEMPLQVLAGVVLLIAVKALMLLIVGRVFALSTQAAQRFAVYLCQGGEFAFVAFTLALSWGIYTEQEKDLLILIVTLSMAVTPLLLTVLTRWHKSAKGSEVDLQAMMPSADETHPIIIAGFGRFGQILGRVLNAKDIHYTAIDRNSDQVQLVRSLGNHVYFGDITKKSFLEKCNVDAARLLVICVDDVEASIEAVRVIKRNYPNLKIFARARNRFHEMRLRELEVDYIIREMLYSALELTREVLVDLGMEKAEAAATVETFRLQDAKLLQQQALLDNDQLSLVQSAKEAAEELKNLLQQEEKH